MNDKRKTAQDKRLEDTAQELQEIQEKIRPFVKPMTFEQYSTAGKWQVSPTPSEKTSLTHRTQSGQSTQR